MALGPQDRARLEAAGVAGDADAAVLSLNGAAWFLRTSPERLQVLGVVRHEGNRAYVELGAARRALRSTSAQSPGQLAAELERWRALLIPLLKRAIFVEVQNRAPRRWIRPDDAT